MGQGRKQTFHSKTEKPLESLLNWLDRLTDENNSGVPVHFLQGFQIIPTDNGYMGVVLCWHAAPHVNVDVKNAHDLATIKNLLGETV
jgi:hypothetical protein